MKEPSGLNTTLQAIPDTGPSSTLPCSIKGEDLLTFLQYSTDNAADEVFWMNSDSEIIYVNRAACQILGYSQDELIGKRVWEWDPLFPKDLWPTFWENLKEKTHIDFETQHQKKNGDIFPVRIKGHYFAHNSQEVVFAFVSDISDIKAKEDKLRLQGQKLEMLVKQKTDEIEREKEKFERFVNLAPVGIAINRMEDGGFEYINSEFSHFTGYTIEELNSMDYWQLTPKEYEEDEHKQIEDMAETGRYGPYEKEYIHKQGHRYPVLLSGIKIKDIDGKEYIWSVAQDITLQKQNKKQLEQAKTLAESLVMKIKIANDSAGIGVWEWDLQSNSLEWDEWMYRLYNVTPNEFSGAYEAWEARVHPDDIGDAKAQLEAAIDGSGTYQPEFRVVLPGGDVRHLKASAEVLRDSTGNALKVIGVNYDVTERAEALEQQNIAKKEAEAASSAKSDFLANMSHEIRTPMNGVLGMLQLLKKSELNEKQRKQLNIAMNSADSFLVLINDILDFSKIEAGKLNIESVEFDLKEQLEAIIESFSHLIGSEPEIRFVNNLSGLSKRLVKGDPTRLRQIISNLLSNAIKFTHHGEIRLEAKLEQATQSSYRFTCSISDTGIGIEQCEINQLFQKFTQADSSTTRKFGGTGLGLSICKSLCELMNGSISATSELQKGSCFVFHVELEKPQS